MLYIDPTKLSAWITPATTTMDHRAIINASILCYNCHDDLLVPNYISSCSIGWRLSKFRIGLTDVSPEEQVPTPSNIDVCASQDAAMNEAETKAFSCLGKGRYLVVVLEATEVLTLCEVQVYEGNL